MGTGYSHSKVPFRSSGGLDERSPELFSGWCSKGIYIHRRRFIYFACSATSCPPRNAFFENLLALLRILNALIKCNLRLFFHIFIHQLAFSANTNLISDCTSQPSYRKFIVAIYMEIRVFTYF